MRGAGDRGQRSARGALAFAVSLLVLSLAAAGGCGGPEPTPGPPMLWVLDGPARVYLFGTIHVPDPRVRELASSVRSAHAAADVVLGEIGQDESGSLKAAYMQFLPPGKRLGDLVPPATLERLRAYLKARGLESRGFERLKPVWVSIQLGLLDALPYLAQTPPMDQVLLADAKKAGKEHGGLETMDEQLGLINGLAYEVQARMLDRTLADLERYRDQGIAPLDVVIEPYQRGDVDAVLTEMKKIQDDPDPDLRAFGQRLLGDRNVVMAERLLARVRAEPEKTWFVGVGAAHLPGPGGLLELLERHGFTARRATREERFAPAAAAEPVTAR